jgi:alpha-glucosidase
VDSSRDPWWRGAVVYQIYPRSFLDTNGDGVGDLRGILAKLDDLVWLGVDGVWISPFFPSPMRDFGYDVADYCGVDPVFGSLADFDALVEAAHQRDLKVLIDWVPAHTSSEHPWFVEARSSRASSRRDWYVWRDAGASGGPPNNWQAAFKNRPAWTWDEGSRQYYLHSFLPEQPDLNWSHPDVRAAMHDTLRFWLDRGVDGFRADVINNIGKAEALEDVEEHLTKLPRIFLNTDMATHEHLRQIRSLLDSYSGERAMVGEVALLSTEQVVAYYGRGDELHMCFNFPPIFAEWKSEAWRGQIETVARTHDPQDAWPTWVLSNHDQKRHRTRYGSEARARAAAVLLLTLRGTPFLYMGEELGLEDAVIPPEREVDPAGRDGCRAPIPWTAVADGGWDSEPWLPWPPDHEGRSRERMRGDEGSILHLYRRLLAARRGSPALKLGALKLLDSPEDTLAYVRTHGTDQRVVAINFASQPRPIELEPAAGAGALLVEVSSTNRGEGEPFDRTLAADEAVILHST